MTRVRDWKAAAFYLLTGFLLNLLWENAQSPLYVWHIGGWTREMRLLTATMTGDMIFMILIYLALATVHRDWLWVNQRDTCRHPATWIIAILLGFLISTSFELWAVYVDHRWQYADAMPIIPVANVGLSPVLQMIVVPILTIGVCGLFQSKSASNASTSSDSNRRSSW